MTTESLSGPTVIYSLAYKDNRNLRKKKKDWLMVAFK